MLCTGPADDQHDCKTRRYHAIVILLPFRRHPNFICCHLAAVCALCAVGPDQMMGQRERDILPTSSQQG